LEKRGERTGEYYSIAAIAVFHGMLIHYTRFPLEIQAKECGLAGRFHGRFARKRIRIIDTPEKTPYNDTKSEKGGPAMDIHVGDELEMKKEHPCGSRRWQVLRVGMDFKLRCQGCSHEVMLPRSKAEKNIRKVFRDGQPVQIK